MDLPDIIIVELLGIASLVAVRYQVGIVLKQGHIRLHAGGIIELLQALRRTPGIVYITQLVMDTILRIGHARIFHTIDRAWRNAAGTAAARHRKDQIRQDENDQEKPENRIQNRPAQATPESATPVIPGRMNMHAAAAKTRTMAAETAGTSRPWPGTAARAGTAYPEAGTGT